MKHSSYIRSRAWAKVRARILSRDSYTCLTCGSQDDLTVDHIIARVSGGSLDDESNLQTLCRSCNSKKGKKDAFFLTARLPPLSLTRCISLKSTDFDLFGEK